MRCSIKGAIIPNDDKWMYDFLCMDATTPNDVQAAINEADGDVLDVEINSPGGEIFAGSEIYAALQAYKGEVNIHIVGQACSAASVIACAGHCDMVRTGMFMIHNVSGSARGDHKAMAHSSKVLKQANKAIAAAYRAKTGKTEKELLESMEAETWLTAEEAVAAGFVDEIAQPVNGLVASTGGMISAETADRLRRQRMTAQIEILKLYGG